MGIGLIQGCYPNKFLDNNKEDSFENITRANSRNKEYEKMGPLNKILNFEEILYNFDEEKKVEKNFINQLN